MYLFWAVLGVGCCVGFLESQRAGATLHLCAASRCCGFSFAEHRLQVHRLQQSWHLGLAAMRHVGSSQIGDQTASSVLIGRWIFNHWTTREIPPVCFNCYVLFHYMDKPCFINPPIGGHLEYLSFLVMKISVMNRFLYIKDRVGRVLRHGQLDLNCLLPVAVCRG